MLSQQFQISVVRIKHFLFVSTDVPWQLRRHPMKPPPGPWAIQKHLPTCGINGLSEVHRTTLFEAITEFFTKSARTQEHSHAHRSYHHPCHIRTPRLSPL